MIIMIMIMIIIIITIIIIIIIIIIISSSSSSSSSSITSPGGLVQRVGATRPDLGSRPIGSTALEGLSARVSKPQVCMYIYIYIYIYIHIHIYIYIYIYRERERKLTCLNHTYRTLTSANSNK